jgi:hypothetical protein
MIIKYKSSHIYISEGSSKEIERHLPKDGLCVPTEHEEFIREWIKACQLNKAGWELVRDGLIERSEAAQLNTKAFNLTEYAKAKLHLDYLEGTQEWFIFEE